MSIDFGKKEAREGYLQTKLDDLLDGINASYGQSLLDELMSRLEATIDDFNKEVDTLMDSLKKSSEEKEKLIQREEAKKLQEQRVKEEQQERERLDRIYEERMRFTRATISNTL